MESAGEVSRLVIYPVKAAAGVEVQKARCTSTGLQHPNEPALRDRRWVVALTTEGGKTIPVSAKAYPRLVLVQPGVQGKVLSLDAPEMPQIKIPIDDSSQEPSKIQTIIMSLGEPIEGIDCGDAVADWLSKYLDKPRMRLLYNAPSLSRRKLCNREFEGMRHTTATPDDQIAFCGACPFLLLGQSSVDDLNTRIDVPVTERNFRANIIVSQSKAYAEDNWEEIQIGDAHLRGSWPCPRCVFVTIDPKTGVKSPENQPLKTLLTYRLPTFDIAETMQKKAMFGRYFLSEQDSIIGVGDKIQATVKQPKYM